MRLLLDTHALLWALAEPEKLPAVVAEALASPERDVYASAINTWELAIKASLGRIKLLGLAFDDLARSIADIGIEELPVTIAHTLRVRELPPHHRDPFDRLLVAQALHEGLALVTADPAIRAYPVQTFWG